MGNEKDGIYIENSASSQLIKNTIGYNKFNGIHIAGPEATDNLISQNSISKNEMKGINLTFGGNEGISPPTILSATTTQVRGTAGGGQTVEIFNDDDDQGQIYLGSTLADVEGNFTFELSSSPQLTNITTTATDASGKTSRFSAPLIVGVEMVTSEQLPDKFALHQNYPNPFNPVTTISYELPVTSDVVLNIFNIKGQLIKTLINDYQDSGNHDVQWEAKDVSSGIYLYKLTAGDYTEVRKCMLLR
ncbi:MAG: T9SS type A sorting domain-containing protein, partial [candidate division KSB1 bacterium]|jgi:parallel beta-helix repeat protein|nr:T9SS type A sorting domain-containing protein [candidate division KSB1 bacterium]